MLGSCMTERKAVKYMNGHERAAASYCAVFFPPRDSTIYIPGTERAISRTDTIPGDSIPCPASDEKDSLKQGTLSYVHCPPSITKTITLTKTDTLKVYLRNTAREDALTLDLDRSNQKFDAANQKIDKLQKFKTRVIEILIALAVLGAGYLFFKSRTALLTSIINKFKSKL